MDQEPPSASGGEAVSAMRYGRSDDQYSVQHAKDVRLLARSGSIGGVCGMAVQEASGDEKKGEDGFHGMLLGIWIHF